jgi:hypothetical protein
LTCSQQSGARQEYSTLASPIPETAISNRIFLDKTDFAFRAAAVIDFTGKNRLWSRNRLSLEPKSAMVLDAGDQLKLRSTILEWGLDRVVSLYRSGDHWTAVRSMTRQALIKSRLYDRLEQESK